MPNSCLVDPIAQYTIKTADWSVPITEEISYVVIFGLQNNLESFRRKIVQFNDKADMIQSSKNFKYTFPLEILSFHISAHFVNLVHRYRRHI